MSNGFSNPYVSSNPLDFMEDVDLYGDAKRIVTQARRGSLGQGGWEYTYKHDPYSSSLGDLGLSDAQRNYLQSNAALGDLTTYDYSGLGSDVNRAFDNIFGDYIHNIAELQVGDTGGLSEGDVRDLFQNAEGTGQLENYQYSVDPVHGSNYLDRAKVGVDSLNLGIQGAKAINFFDPDSIANALNQMGGWEGDAGIKGKEILALDPDLIEEGQESYYAPIIEDARERATYSLADSLAQDMTGGFAGSSSPASRKKRARELYGSEIGKILEKIMQITAGKKQDLLSQIMGYKELFEDRKSTTPGSN